MQGVSDARIWALRAMAHFSTGGTKPEVIADFIQTSGYRLLKWMDRMGAFCRRLIPELLRGKIQAHLLQFDELKTFCKSKEHECWVWTGIEAVTKLWLALVVGIHDGENGKNLVKQAKRSLASLPLAITTDALGAYLGLIRKYFPTVPYAQVQKIYEGKKLVEIKTESFKPAGFMEIERVMASLGLGSSINTSFVERHNKTIRRENACMQRKTDSTNKKVEALWNRMALHQFYYNFIRRQKGLGWKTPAQAAGVTERRWSWEELFGVRLCDYQQKVR